MQMDQIGKGIAQRRKALGLSQEEMAKQIGVTRQAVSKWESGAAMPSVDNMIELSRVLGVSVDELLQLTEGSREAGLSAESVGRLLDEQALRQEKRIRRLTAALIVSAAALVLGIALTSVLGMLRTDRMEESLNRQIASTNSQLHSSIAGINASIAGINASIAGTVKQALDEGNTLLADGGMHAYEYVHETRSIDLRLFAYPQVMGDVKEAEFSVLLRDGTRISVPAQVTAAGFEGKVSIPAEEDENDSLYVNAYVSWQQDGQTVTEKILTWTFWLDEMRMRIVWTGASHLTRDVDGLVTLLPGADIIAPEDRPETWPEKARFEIFVRGEKIGTLEADCVWEEGMVLRRATPEEEIQIQPPVSFNEITVCVTVTDASDHEFTDECTFEESEY